MFIALVIAQFTGLFDNPYAGLVVFIALPAIFVLGCCSSLLGMWLQQRKLQRDPTAATGWPVIDFSKPVVRRRTLMFVALTAVNVIILLLAGYGSLHWMDSPQFCGQVCHAPMHPQFTAWRDGPHSRIACAKCHIGEGAQGFVNAKLAGTGNLCTSSRVTCHSHPAGRAHASWRPGSTCQGCHRPSRTGADRIRVIREYADDEGNTETVTVLQMFMGGPTSARSLDSLARRPRKQDRVRRDRRRPPDNHLHQSHRCEGPGQGIPRGRGHRSGDQQRHSPDDGLRRLPQHRGTSHFADRANEWSTGPSRPERSVPSFHLRGVKVLAGHCLIPKRG